MLISYNEVGKVSSINGFRMENYSRDMIDDLLPIEGYDYIRIYDAETINRVWEAVDTGGIVQVKLNAVGEPIGIIAENGDLEPPTENTNKSLSPIEQLGIELSQREINEIIQGRQISDIEIRLLMGGL